ncbi:H-NS histone family protein [Pararobbsia alpina]|uniref:DNA-binding protein H-NS-like C-terminal domain-containing protein n=1 Tax=Pararobbsia alpina TaxID=621374 RepID=A0A6S7BHA2_9BURK|nr:H-NS histone family protein [Pararobbsia alpina]CAB3791138.1 hypothetical protein LMG28138_03123 [Pararobbsia alpina]
MPTLTQIQARIARLQLQAEAIAAKQISAALDEITTLMTRHGVTTADIASHLSASKPRGRLAGKKAGAKAGVKSLVKTGGRRRGRPAKASTASAGKAKLPAKYLNPKTGETWSGWARPPLWIKDVKDRTKFLIDGAAATAVSKPAEGIKARVKQSTARKATSRKGASKRVAAGKPKTSRTATTKTPPVKTRARRTNRPAANAPAVEASAAGAI